MYKSSVIKQLSTGTQTVRSKEQNRAQTHTHEQMEIEYMAKGHFRSEEKMQSNWTTGSPFKKKKATSPFLILK